MLLSLFVNLFLKFLFSKEILVNGAYVTTGQRVCLFHGFSKTQMVCNDLHSIGLASFKNVL